MKSSLLFFLPALLRNEQSARHAREKARTRLDLALQKLKAWKEQGCTSSGLCYTVSHTSVYLHRVLAEHQGGGSEAISHGPGGSGGSIREVLISRRCMGVVHTRGCCHQ